MSDVDVLFTSDLHGSAPHYEETFRLARDSGARAVILGGDLGPAGDPADQLAFLRSFVIPLLRRHVEAPGAAEVYYLFGNGDWRANEAILERAGLPCLHYIHGRVVPFLDGALLAGLAYVPPTPIPLKDWERWEGASSAARADGFRSAADGSQVPFTFRGREKEELLSNELRALEEEISQARAAPGHVGEAHLLCVTHGPPSDTACDQIAGGVHVGSLETRRFLERVRPLVSLHGHIHESPSVSGRFADRVGTTVCVNPGQSKNSFHAVTFGLDRFPGSLRHTLLGPAKL